ncbi:hypothetical protein N783_01140 [Pontibacillus marinus BH030004 = DSM 16465]|uniref:CBM20 domain-containing protein n=1 Tax=Pontibacillus marinus BH030004 = DSM 16465 TaxID=1385511 RepID=A0A0A5GDR3_9BACI|nr:hypothetical protein N783_01140 [Pontibacillus marinus BH030004 = DSM 16465]
MFNQVIYSYPTWYYDVSVPAGTSLEFKFIKIDGSGNVVWEGGANHTYTTPTSGTGGSYSELEKLSVMQKPRTILGS